MNKPVFVISCPYDTYSGYGARSRDIVKAIINTNRYDVKLLPQRWGSTSFNFCTDHPEWSYLNDLTITKMETKPDVWMQITIPNEFQPVGKYNIGCTAGIEATICKPEWIEGLNRMDVNWVSSTFAKGVFESVNYEKRNKQTQELEKIIKVEKPIEVIFEGANLDVYKPISGGEIKTIDFQDIKESFCFLNVGHWIQGDFGHDRKNLALLIKAFYETFKGPNSPKPALILKASMGVASYISRDSILDKIKNIRDTVNSPTLPNIYLLNGEFDDGEMNELYNHPKVKAMVSLTKGEGFGRPLLEFSLTGKPIIASGWSGHLDFLKPEFSTLIGGELEKVHSSAANQWLVPEAQWFKPSPASIGKNFKECYKKYKHFISKSKQQKQFSKSNFSYKKMEELVDIVLKSYVPNFPSQVNFQLPELQLPKLKKI
jgi:glycosyltransferase involved in cell wall biosynthesis